MKWCKITGTGYEVSDNGLIRNIKTGKIRKTFKGGTSPYLVTQLRDDSNKVKSFLVHRLVAISFISNPENKSQVNHKDGNKLNNSVENLEWVSPSENMQHALIIGVFKRYDNQTYKGKNGKDHNRSIKIKCSNGQIYHGYREASESLGVHLSTIHLALRDNRPLRNGISFEVIK
jgi:hypothetical protein